MAKRDWRLLAIQVTGDLELGVWYRSPLWDKDHIVGEDPVWFNDGISWCGRSLAYARDWDNNEAGRLYFTNRTSAQCAECKRRQVEWEGRGQW